MTYKLKTLLPAIFLLTFLQTVCAQPSPLKILFVGNSISSFNGMPDIFKQLALEKNHPVSVHTITFDGMRLNNYLKEVRVGESLFVSVLDTIAVGNFSFVIIQDGLSVPVKPFEKTELFYKAVVKFDSICKKHASQLVVFEPYPIPVFPKIYCGRSLLSNEMRCTEAFFDEKQLLDSIKVCFDQLRAMNIIVAPIGDAFVSASASHPVINLYADDEDFHPSAFGSYLIACVYYRTCFSGKIQSKVCLPASCSNALVAQKIANEITIKESFVRIKLTDTLMAKPPFNMDYDQWISAHPSMKKFKALGGVYESIAGVKFTISIGDGNNNGVFGETGSDVVYLTDYSEKYFEWDNSCSNVSVVQSKTVINYQGSCFMVDSICPDGSFIDLKQVSCTQQPHLWKSINLPLEQKLNVMDGEAISILDYLESYAGKAEYVFVNFWAPWCAPCIEEIPQLQLLHQKNVAIINIVEEYSYEEAKIAISKYSMPGLQVAGEEYVSKIFNHCGNGFPYGVLYKRNQEIGRGIRAHQVEKLIKNP